MEKKHSRVRETLSKVLNVERETIFWYFFFTSMKYWKCYVAHKVQWSIAKNPAFHKTTSGCQWFMKTKHWYREKNMEIWYARLISTHPHETTTTFLTVACNFLLIKLENQEERGTRKNKLMVERECCTTLSVGSLTIIA